MSAGWLVSDVIKLAINLLQQVYNMNQLGKTKNRSKTRTLMSNLVMRIKTNHQLSLIFLIRINTVTVTLTFIHTLGAHEPFYFGPQFFVSFGSAKNASAAVSGLYITHAILTAHYNAVTLMAARAIKLPAQVSIFCYSFVVSTVLLGLTSAIGVILTDSFLFDAVRHFSIFVVVSFAVFTLQVCFLQLRSKLLSSRMHTANSTGPLESNQSEDKRSKLFLSRTQTTTIMDPLKSSKNCDKRFYSGTNRDIMSTPMAGISIEREIKFKSSSNAEQIKHVMPHLTMSKIVSNESNISTTQENVSITEIDPDFQNTQRFPRIVAMSRRQSKSTIHMETKIEMAPYHIRTESRHPLSQNAPSVTVSGKGDKKGNQKPKLQSRASTVVTMQRQDENFKILWFRLNLFVVLIPIVGALGMLVTFVAGLVSLQQPSDVSFSQHNRDSAQNYSFPSDLSFYVTILVILLEQYYAHSQSK